MNRYCCDSYPCVLTRDIQITRNVINRMANRSIYFSSLVLYIKRRDCRNSLRVNCQAIQRRKYRRLDSANANTKAHCTPYSTIRRFSSDSSNGQSNGFLPRRLQVRVLLGVRGIPFVFGGRYGPQLEKQNLNLNPSGEVTKM